jgi:hypothetical protein
MEHKWVKYCGYYVCKMCGLIKRRDNKNSPCNGKVTVSIRKTNGIENGPAEQGR